MKRASLLVLIAVVGMVVIAGADRFFRFEAQRLDAAALRAAFTHTAEHLGEDLHYSIAAIESLAGFMQVSATQPGFERFDEFAAHLLARHKSIQALAYIDSNGVIRHFYPKRGNESAIGLDLKRRPAAPFVATAIRERRTTVNHPTHTVQGSLAVIARTPFYRDGRLAGLVQGVFDVSQVVAKAAASPDPRIGYELRDAEGQRFFGTESLLADPLTATVTVGDNHWQLRVGWLSAPPGPASALLALLWIGGLLLLASLLVLVWRTQARELWLRAAVAEQTKALHDREQLLRLVLDALPVGVWVTDKQGKIVSGNPEGQRIWAGARYVATDQYGEYKGWWADTGKPIAADEWALARAIRHGETSLNEVIDIECFDGTRKTILNSALPIRADGNEIAGAIVVNQDITERKRVEQATQRLNRLLNTLGAINPALVRAESEAQLFAGVCRTLVEQGEFSMAWVGLADAATQRVQMACQSGFQHGYLDKLDIRYDDSPQGQGPTGTAIRSGQTVINDDTETNPLFAPWRERAREHGYRSTVAIPLQVHGQVIGSLNVYAAAPHVFGSQEVVLLEKLAGDIGMAVERQRAIDRIATSERELATILQNMQDTYYRTDQDGRIVRASESATKLLGYAPDDVLGMRLADFYVDADGRERFLAALKAAGGMLRNYEAALRHRNGAVRWVSTNAQYVRDIDGKVIGIEGTTRDVTERKRAEDRLLDIARGVSATTGETFFHSLVAHLVQSLQADFAFVGQLAPDQSDRIRTIAVQTGDQHVDDFEYDLAGTPCQNVVGRETCAYPRAVQEQFPDDHMLAEMGVQAYVGTPLFGSNGESLGLVVVLYRRPIEQDEPIGSTLEIFAARAAAELERLRAEESLKESEERYRSVIASMEEGIVLQGADLQIIAFNPSALRILGLTEDQLRGRTSMDPCWRAVHEDGTPFPDETHPGTVTLRTGIPQSNVIMGVHRPDGTLVWIMINSQPLFRPGATLPHGSVATFTDVTAHKLAEQALVQSENNFRTLTENANVGILVNHRGKHVFANNRLLDMLGYTADEIHETGVKELVHPMEYDKVVVCFRDRMENKSAPSMYETVFMTKTGQAVPVELTAAKTTWQGEPAGLVMLQDIRERLRAETQMRKLSSALEQTADSVVITDRAGVIEYVNPGFEKTTGYSRDEALGQTPRLVKSGKQGAGFYKKLWGTILAGEVFSEVFVNRRKDGSLYYEEKTITPLKDAAGQVANFVATGKDVTERMQAQERLQHMAQHDALTELPNRLLFMDRLKQALARARWHERLVAVLFVDLDRFKTINDTLGHETGDKLLQALAGRLTASVREGDTVARFGGDEFAMLLDDVASEKDIGAVAQKVIEMLAPPFEIDGQSLYITASIGVSLYPNDGEDSTTLLKNADIAMYRAKDLGKNTYQFYSADMSARAFERLTLESSLRHAIERNEFRLYYQPQIDTASGAMLGVEALLRWQHPDFGLVAPAEFIPLLEETGLIVPVGDWVFRTACEQLRVWHTAGWPTLRMAVNLSPRQFQTAGLATMVERGLDTVGCDPGLIELEITENVLLRHTAVTLDALEALRSLGVRLAIDDFGTGYSSLSYLRRYSIDTLKIDRSFVHDVPGDADDSALASAIIVLARSLNLDVIAEGVETEAQRKFLQERGCRVMQGYLFSRPLPADELTVLLGKQPDPLRG